MRTEPLLKMLDMATNKSFAKQRLNSIFGEIMQEKDASKGTVSVLLKRLFGYSERGGVTNAHLGPLIFLPSRVSLKQN
jgi:hypothetical protein